MAGAEDGKDLIGEKHNSRGATLGPLSRGPFFIDDAAGLVFKDTVTGNYWSLTIQNGAPAWRQVNLG